jgi:hypothetical protein
MNRSNESGILIESIIGKTLNEARELASFNGYSTRVTREDSTDYWVTMDLRFDRINLQLDNGVVTKCNIG